MPAQAKQATRTDARPRPFKRAYTIGDISRMYGLCRDSLLYYEERGILNPRRQENGYRVYGEDDIWRINVIVNLRGLGFSVERIREYFQSRSLNDTIDLLMEELNLIELQEKNLSALRESVKSDLRVIHAAQNLELCSVSEIQQPARRAFQIDQPFSTEEEMDLLMKELVQRSEKRCRLIGNNQIAALVADERCEETYRGALIFSPEGDVEIPGGAYLSLCYRGRWDSRNKAALLRRHAAAHRLTVANPTLDIIWIDIHTAFPTDEHISEVQCRVRAAS